MSTKGTITPRKITRYVLDIKCACGRKITYCSYETNKKRAMQRLPKLWNGWRLLPKVYCFPCRVNFNEEEKELRDIINPFLKKPKPKCREGYD